MLTQRWHPIGFHEMVRVIHRALHEPTGILWVEKVNFNLRFETIKSMKPFPDSKQFNRTIPFISRACVNETLSLSDDTKFKGECSLPCQRHPSQTQVKQRQMFS